jgi:mannitol-1-phosphate 5-dehydrogenase
LSGEIASEILIIGAGAIGRGFLPWCFRGSRLTFVDSNPAIVKAMQEQRRYRTYRAREGQLDVLDVSVDAVFTPTDFRATQARDWTAAFISVGPRHAAMAAAILRGYKGPVILCENDPATVKLVEHAAGSDRVYFAVPDVITSNTAPDRLLAEDALSVVTEDGVLFLDAAAGAFPGDYKALPAGELILTQWTAKLFLHNTPHCVAAYLGALVGVRYLHEAMAIREIDAIVSGAMTEMLNSLKLRWEIPHAFLEWYADKELARFRNTLLCDPIARVAREPLRKLETDGRLIGAAQVCLASGFIPRNLLSGIASALLFSSDVDADRHLSFMRKALSPPTFISHILALRPGEALEIILREQLPLILPQLERLGQQEGHP